jgi:hypothetical protein
VATGRDRVVLSVDTAESRTRRPGTKGGVMSRGSRVGLRIVLLLLGALTILAGLNKALGGLRTLGWQGEIASFEVTHEHAFLVLDSHVRFLAAVYTGLGLIFLLAAADPRRFRTPLGVACALIFAGGLARLSQMRPEVTFGPDLLVSMVAELALMPFLWWWATRIGSRDRGWAAEAKASRPG